MCQISSMEEFQCYCNLVGDGSLGFWSDENFVNTFISRMIPKSSATDEFHDEAPVSILIESAENHFRHKFASKSQPCNFGDDVILEVFAGILEDFFDVEIWFSVDSNLVCGSVGTTPNVFGSGNMLRKSVTKIVDSDAEK